MYARELHESMSDVVWSIQPKNETIGSFIQRGRAFTTEVCEGKGMTFSFRVESSLEEIAAPPQVLRNLLLFLKESVTNAARHSRCRSLTVMVDSHHPGISITVVDDGTGFEPTSNKSGNGMKNMAERIRKIGGEFKLDTGPGRGTRITAVVPVEKN
jgi:signal transduction histidine kinase